MIPSSPNRVVSAPLPDFSKLGKPTKGNPTVADVTKYSSVLEAELKTSTADNFFLKRDVAALQTQLGQQAAAHQQQQQQQQQQAQAQIAALQAQLGQQYAVQQQQVQAQPGVAAGVVAAAPATPAVALTVVGKNVVFNPLQLGKRELSAKVEEVFMTRATTFDYLDMTTVCKLYSELFSWVASQGASEAVVLQILRSAPGAVKQYLAVEVHSLGSVNEWFSQFKDQSRFEISNEQETAVFKATMEKETSWVQAVLRFEAEHALTIIAQLHTVDKMMQWLTNKPFITDSYMEHNDHIVACLQKLVRKNGKSFTTLRAFITAATAAIRGSPKGKCEPFGQHRCVWRRSSRTRSRRSEWLRRQHLTRARGR